MVPGGALSGLTPQQIALIQSAMAQQADQQDNSVPGTANYGGPSPNMRDQIATSMMMQNFADQARRSGLPPGVGPGDPGAPSVPGAPPVAPPDSPAAPPPAAPP